MEIINTDNLLDPTSVAGIMLLNPQEATLTNNTGTSFAKSNVATTSNRKYIPEPPKWPDRQQRKEM